MTAAAGPAKLTGEGLVARFSPISGITPQAALGGRLWLPAVLNTLTVSETAMHNEYDTLTGGHFSQPQMGDNEARQFETASVDAIVVEFDAPYLVATGQHPQEVRAALRRILRYKKPVHLLVTQNPNPWGLPAEVDMFVTFRQIDRDVRPGEADSRYYTIQISEWRDPSSRRRSATPTSAHSRKKGVKLPTTHRLTATDTLHSLAFDYYGRYDRWRYIRDANGISKKFGMRTPIVTLPGRWKIGSKIKIPRLPAARSAL